MAIALDFSGKVVVVVGGTSGINRGIAECFATHGAKVAVASRKQAKVDETVSVLKGLGTQAMGFAADVREPDALEAGMQAVHERFGDFDDGRLYKRTAADAARSLFGPEAVSRSLGTLLEQVTEKRPNSS